MPESRSATAAADRLRHPVSPLPAVADETTTVSSQLEGRVAAVRLAAYATPSMPFAMLLVPILTYLPTFYALDRGFSLKLVGLAFLCGRLLDSTADPIVGWLSDQARSRGGRHATWLIGGVPFLMLAIYALCEPPPTVAFGTLVLLLALFYVANAVVQIPYFAWGSDLSSEYAERNRIGTFREAGFMIGMMLAVGLPMLLAQGGGSSLKPILKVYSTSLLVLLPLTIAVAVIFADEAPPAAIAPVISARDALRAILRSKPLRVFALAFWIMDTGLSMFDATIALFFAGALGMPNFLPLVLVEYMCSLACLPLWLRVGERLDKHVALCLFAVGYSIPLAALAFAPAGATWCVVAAMMLKGACVPAFRVMPASIMADLADYWELKSGQSLMGVYMSLLQVLTKIGMAAGIGLAFPLLGALGFDTSPGGSDTNRVPLLLVCCVLPIALLWCSSLIVLRFPISRRRHAVIRRRIVSRMRPTPG